MQTIYMVFHAILKNEFINDWNNCNIGFLSCNSNFQLQILSFVPLIYLREEFDLKNNKKYAFSRFFVGYSFNPFQSCIAFHEETSHMTWTVNHMTSFYMNCSTGLKWVELSIYVFTHKCLLFWMRSLRSGLGTRKAKNS